jgi:hypothetical protein
MDREEISAAILGLIAERGDVTFAELESEIPGFSGCYAIHHADDPNLVLWPFLSAHALEALLGLLSSGAIHVHPIASLSYRNYGRAPSMPLAHRPRPSGYREPHWLPASLRLDPFLP